MEINYKIPRGSYFAAANGYDGFRSYFNKVFAPKDYKRLYVLKGGPGTGKSSFMKRIREHFLTLGFGCDSIFCSSDRASLDGVIIYGKNGIVGLLDGTAPHEVDTRLPGAVDEIINLGAAWDKVGLSKQKNDIEMLTAEKKKRYENAYFFMRAAGSFHCNKCGASPTCSPSDCYIDEIEKYTKILTKNSGRIRERYLLSCFSKDGYSSSLAYDFKCKNKVSVCGGRGEDFIFFDLLLKTLEKNGSAAIRFPTPLSDALTDAVFIPESDTLIFADRTKTKDADILLSGGMGRDAFSDFCAEENALLLKKAEEEFAAASRCHFELEGIYTPHMNFDIVAEMREKVISEIENMIAP